MKTNLTIADLKLMVEDELLRLAAGKEPSMKCCGICYHISNTFDDASTRLTGSYLPFNGYLLVEKLSKGWEYHSGNTLCPVPIRWVEDCLYPAPMHWAEDSLWAGYKGYYRRDLCEYLAGKVRVCSNHEFSLFCLLLAL